MKVQLATNVHTVAQYLPVGAKLNQFWKTCGALGVSSKVIRILREGCTLPPCNQPTLARSPIIKSGYMHPLRNNYPIKALHALIQKNALERSKIRHLWLSSTDFLGSTIQQQMETYLGSELTQQISETDKFKMEKSKARGTWSLPENKLHINYLELKTVFLAL